MAPTYPDAARALLARCAEYRERSIDLGTFKASVWSAANEFVIPQERETRDYLQQVEGKLDILEFTVDDDKLFDATLELVAGIEDTMNRYLSGSTT